MAKVVLYLSYDGLTDPLGQSQILPYVEGLADMGYRFHILTFEKRGRYKILRRTIEQRCEKRNIHWHPMIYTKSPPVLSTLYDLNALYRYIINNRELMSASLIHCRSYLTALLALRIKKRFSIPFIFDMRGFWADERVDGKIWNLINPMYKIIYNYFKRKERAFLEEAAAVISLTHAGKNEMVRWFHEDSRFGGNMNYYNHDHAVAIERKTTVIPCAADLDHFDPNRISENKKKWLCAVHGLDHTLEYIGYVGSLGTWYMSNEMLALYRHLLSENPRLRFLILSHDDTQGLINRAETIGIPLSYITQIRATRKEVPVLMSLMSASVFFILPAFSKMASSPTKQGELMAMGVPIFCNSGVGDTSDIINKGNAGIVIDGFDEYALKAMAAKWSSLCEFDSIEIREVAEEYFSLDKGVKAYAQVYKSIL